MVGKTHMAFKSAQVHALHTNAVRDQVTAALLSVFLIPLVLGAGVLLGCEAPHPQSLQNRESAQGGSSAPLYSSDEEATLLRTIDVDLARRKLDEAETLVQNYLRRRPDSAQALYRLGLVFFNKHNWARSMTYLLRSLKVDFHNDRAHLILGLDYFQMHHPEEAEKELLIAVQQNPESDENQYMAGRLFFTEQKIDKAVACFYAAIRLNPENFKAHDSLGLCFQNLANYSLAEHYYKRALEIAEKHHETYTQGYLDLAELLTGTESTRVPEGEAYARHAAELEPDSAQAHYLIGKALYREGKPAMAVTELLKSGRLDPQDSRPHFILARIYQKMGRRAEAKGEWSAFDRLTKLKVSPQPSPLTDLPEPDRHAPPP